MCCGMHIIMALLVDAAAGDLVSNAMHGGMGYLMRLILALSSVH